MDSSRNHGGPNMGGSNVDIEGAAEAAYVAACKGNIGHTAGAHVPWDEVDPYYQNQFRRQARAVIDHVMPSPDLFSQEGE